MARVMTPMAKHLITLLDSYCTSDGTYELPSTVSVEALMNLALEIGGEDLSFYSKADEVVWAVARHEGYVVPDFPLDSNSEVKGFLAEHGVATTTGWYLKRGLPIMTVTHLWLYSCFMARNLPFWRRLLVFEANEVTDVNRLACYIRDALTFCLSEQTSDDDASLFAV
ncbi:hypothetical protein [Atopobium fossor]|uniref:hypothetical protein n=1 Tax=Atopobium fossor TaxID=39487 RepID=UPI000403CB92|nr:hypothetical protein [Atopobium fossor]